MKRNRFVWDIQFVWNLWASIGIHIDHINLRIDFHLPFVVIFAGNMRCRGGARIDNRGIRKLFKRWGWHDTKRV